MKNEFLIGSCLAITLLVVVVPRLTTFPSSPSLESESGVSLQEAIRKFYEGGRFNRVSVELQGCELRIRREDTSICEIGKPHSLWLYEDVVDLSLLDGATFSVIDSNWSDYSFVIRYEDSQIERSRNVSDEGRILFSTLNPDGSPRVSKWMNAEERDAGLNTFVRTRVVGNAANYRITTDCEKFAG